MLKNLFNEGFNTRQGTEMGSIKNILYWLIANSLGGLNRGRILNELFKKPENANELSNSLNIDYKTIRYHLEILINNNLIESAGPGYGKTYFITEELMKNKRYFYDIWNQIKEK